MVVLQWRVVDISENEGGKEELVRRRGKLPKNEDKGEKKERGKEEKIAKSISSIKI